MRQPFANPKTLQRPLGHSSWTMVRNHTATVKKINLPTNTGIFILQQHALATGHFHFCIGSWKAALTSSFLTAKLGLGGDPNQSSLVLKSAPVKGWRYLDPGSVTEMLRPECSLHGSVCFVG